MFCKKCGKEIDDNAKFCMHCGNSINEEAKNEDEKNDKVNKILEDINKETKNKSNKKGLKLIIIAIIVLAIIIAIVMFVINSGVNLKSAYNKVLDQNSSYSKYMTLASDNSYIEIDTNPSDKDDYYSYDAFELVKAMNKELGFSESLENKMLHTRSLDGKQSDKANNVEVTWTYHPDKGLEIQYTKSK